MEQARCRRVGVQGVTSLRPLPSFSPGKALAPELSQANKIQVASTQGQGGYWGRNKSYDDGSQSWALDREKPEGRQADGGGASTGLKAGLLESRTTCLPE